MLESKVKRRKKKSDNKKVEKSDKYTTINSTVNNWSILLTYHTVYVNVNQNVTYHVFYWFVKDTKTLLMVFCCWKFLTLLLSPTCQCRRRWCQLILAVIRFCFNIWHSPYLLTGEVMFLLTNTVLLFSSVLFSGTQGVM